MGPLVAPPQLTRHQFLARLHEIVKPQTYLEVGVQTGGSLALAEAAGVAIGIDPHLDHFAQQFRRPNQRLFEQTADDYFGCMSCERPTIDLAFIDGSHLFEDALRDFIYVQRHSGPDTIVVFDDVLPYSQDIAWRVQPPGDWTGDVFKIPAVLAEYQPDLDLRLVDVAPTGALVVTGLNVNDVTLGKKYDRIAADWHARHYVPDEILARTNAAQPDKVLADIAAELAQTRKGK
jgi:hypothetical protein